MNFDIGKIFDEFVALYARLPLAQKIAIPVLLAASVGTVVFVSRWASRPDYQVLYSGLADSDAASVVEHLKDKKVGFRLRDNGATVEVTPPSLVNELRLELANAGLPKGHSIGFELFNENALGRTRFVEEVYLIRAIQGELERTISSIESVKGVRIHITKPESSVFESKNVLPTASVLLNLKPGAELTPVQIKGMANLVSSAVERLLPENVTILDTNGNQLNKEKEDEALGGAELSRIEYQRSIEKAYVQRIESMLTEILGPGHAVARVTAELDFNKYEKEEEMYDPAGTVTRSERTVDENAASTDSGGVPGVISNLTGEANPLNAQQGANAGNRRNEIVKNYEVSRSVSRTVSEVGKVSRVSAAVLVDGKYRSEPTGETDATGAPVAKDIYVALDAATIRKIENLVKQAVGYDSARGDEITVENIQFKEGNKDLSAEFKESDTERWMNLGLEYILPVLFLLLFFLIIVRPLMRFLLKPTDSEADLGRLLPAGIEELEAELEAERAKLKSVPELPEATIDIEELEELLAENSRLVKENPQQAALLIRYWLNEVRM